MYSLPYFSQRFGQLGIVHLTMLSREFPAGLLGPHHEGVHGALHMDLLTTTDDAPRG